MFRIRITLVTALVVALAAVAISSQAQQPPGGRGGGGGGRGQRGGGGGPGGGPGGPGGFGGPGGGPGGSLVALAGNEAVAKELKLTDRQKARVKQISEDQTKKSGEVFQQLRQQTDRAKAQAEALAQAQALQGGQQIDPSVDARGAGAGNPLAGALNQRGYQPQVYGGRVQGGQVDPAQQQQAARFQGRRAGNAVQQQGWQMMREAMQELQQASESALAGVLDRNQVKRLKEIQLQVQGPGAVLREDVAEKLEINEDQHAEIQSVLAEANTQRREIMQKNFQFMRTLVPQQPAGGNPPAAGGQPDANAPAAAGGAQGGQAAQPGQAAQTGQNGRGGRGGRGGANGQNNRGNFNREAFQKAMEQPEVKAKVEEARTEAQKQQAQLRDREYAMVFKAMDRRQVAVFKRMLGKPFDVDSITNGFFRGGPGGPGGPGGRRNGANGNANQTPAAAAAKADTAKTTTPANADSSAASPTTTTPRRQSLRERRGLGGQQPTPDAESPQ